MFAAVYVPDFSLQGVLRHEAELRSRPAALIDTGPFADPSGNSHVGRRENRSKAILVQLTPAARAAGVNIGMTPPQAVARCPEILIKARSSAQEQAAGEMLLQVAFSFSPRIEASAPGVCTLDLKGISALENENRSTLEVYAQTIRGRYAEFHLDARVGIAEIPDLALHAAHSAQSVRVVLNSDEFMAGLPIESMETSPEIVRVLHRWGIRTVGEFMALGKERLAERLDAEAIELFERASVLESRPLRLVTPPENYEESTEFENEIESLEPLLFFLRRFIGQISHRLDLVYLVVDELRLTLTLTSGAIYERTFRIPSATRNVDTLFRMLHTHLENFRTDAPIAALHLAAKPSPPQIRQFTLFETSLRDPNQFSETLARVAALLGADRVGTPVLEATHRPDAFHLQPVNFETDRKLIQASSANHRAGLALRRFRPPISASVKMQGDKPVFLRCAQYAGPIQHAEGPWRSSGNWWEDQAWERDEWDVQTREGLYRLYRKQENWFLEGVYD